MQQLKVYLETFGCQMNKLDSETAAERLLNNGYALADDIADADVVLYNTCSVREHAEDKVFSHVGTLKQAKLLKPGLIVGVMGCMAQKEGENIFRRSEVVDIVCGPKQEENLVELIAEARNGNRVLALDGSTRIRDRRTPPTGVAVWQPEQAGEFHRRGAARPLDFQAFVAVMLGCNNFCSYCIVPYVRGPEESRPAGEIVEEAKRLAESGVKELILLGQNVNSYAGEGGLARLLHKVHEVQGLERIRFVTSHPRDVTDDLLRAMAALPKVCEHLHAPAQSGSSAVLKRMNRGYTREQYDDMLDRARRIVPNIEIASDFIVGFPGETEEDYRQTVDLVQRADFNQCFIFKYSPRPGTKAAGFDDDVPTAEKKRRNNELLAVQEEVSTRRNRQKQGQVVEILVEGQSKNDASKFTGRTRGYDIVVVEGQNSMVGQVVKARVVNSTPLTLFGELAE